MFPCVPFSLKLEQQTQKCHYLRRGDRLTHVIQPPVSRNKDKMAEVQDPDERALIKVHAPTKVTQFARSAPADRRQRATVGR